MMRFSTFFLCSIFLLSNSFDLSGAEPPQNLNLQLQGENNVILTWEAPQGGEAELIFHESFEGLNDATFPPAGWGNVDNDGDGRKWILFDVPYSESVNPYPAYDGINAAASYSWFSGSTLTPDNWLITPPIPVPGNALLQWAVAAQRPNYSQEHYKVYISTTGNSVSDFNLLIHEETLPAQDITWKLRQFDLSSYQGQQIYVAFVHTQTTDLFAIKLDDIRVYGLANASHSGYRIYRNNHPIATISDVLTSSYTDSGLEPGDYEYHLTALYGENESAPSNTVNTTIVVPVIDFPPINLQAVIQGTNVLLSWQQPDLQAIFLWEDFEGLTDHTFPPAGWKNIDNDNAGMAWILFDVPYSESANPYPAYSGTQAMASYSWFNGTTFTPDNWFITPKVSLGNDSRLSWAAAAQRPNYSQEHYKVYISTTGSNIENFSTLVFEETMPDQDITWKVREIDLSAYDGQDVNIAFVHNGTTDLFAIKIDAILLDGKADLELTGWQIFRDGDLISEINDPASMSFTDANMPYGQFTYHIKAVFNKGISTGSEPIVVNLAPQQEFNVEISVQGQGSVTPGTGHFTYVQGTSLDLVATAAENWKFENWIINQQDVQQPSYTVVVDQDLNIVAVFSEEGSTSAGSIAGSEIRVFPNPSSGMIRISSAEALVAAQIGIYNLTGQLVYEKTGVSGNNYEFNLQGINPGVYFIRISGTMQSIRLIIN
jgi:hypothetical protein